MFKKTDKSGPDFAGSVSSATLGSGEGVFERTGETVASLALSSVMDGVDSILDSRLRGGRSSSRRSFMVLDDNVGGNERFLGKSMLTGDPGGVILTVDI